MNLHIEERESEGIVRLDLKGHLTKISMVLNLNEVTGIDSTGLGTLAFELAGLRRSGGTLALVNLNESHLDLFLATMGEFRNKRTNRSLTIAAPMRVPALAFELLADEQEAIGSFFPDRELRHFDSLSFVQHEGGGHSNSGAPSGAAC